MSNYWKKKLDELNAEKEKETVTPKSSNSSNYWQNQMDELEEENKKKKAADDDIAPVKVDFTKNEASLTSKILSGNSNWASPESKDNNLMPTPVTVNTTRPANILDITWNSIKRGWNNSMYGQESYKEMMGVSNEKEAYEQILAGDDYNFKVDGWFEKAISGASEQIGQQVRQWTNPTSTAAATAAMLTVAAAGQAGPQVAIPEEIISVPAAGIIGLQIGSAKANFEIEAGLAYNEMVEAGISEDTARNVALAVGGGNAALELIQADELLKAWKVTSKGATKSFVKELAEELARRGIDVATETAQEVAQEGITIAGTQFASKAETGEWAYSADEVKDRLGDTAVSSLLTFGTLNVPATAKNVTSIANDHKAANTLTTNEQKVFDKVYNDKIAEKEADGTKLTQSEKNKIYDEVREDVDNGGIGIDKIAEVLGGETYENYKAQLDSEDATIKELEELYGDEAIKNEFSRRLAEAEANGQTLTNKEKGKLYQSIATEMQAELETSKNDVLSNPTKGTLEQQLYKEVFDTVKGKNDSRLLESFNERARATQNYKADLTKYTDENAKKTIQNIMDAGVANNTNKVHKFADMLAKISADKGIVFSVTSAQKLAGTRYAVEGKTVNGFITEDGITINLSSPKAINSVAGHEIAHALEGTEFYDEFIKAAEAYAKTKGEYDSRYRDALKTYRGVKGYEGAQGYAKIKNEVVADLVGDYLFTDSDFINHLSVNHRNTFMRIWDEIKYLGKIVAAGSQEARDLERVKKAFEDAYRGEGEEKTGTTFSLGLDNAQELVYNGTRGDVYARTDEFRNLQAESQGMSDEDTQLYWSGNKQIDDGLRERLSRSVKQIFLDARNNGNGNDSRLLSFSSKGNQFNLYENTDAALFRDVFEISRKHLRHGELVDLHEVETTKDHGIGYKYCKNYLSEDGLSGFSITPDGDLISVFNASGKSGFLRAIAPFVKENANTLDCYASPHQNLMGMYETIFGFKTASVMDYNMEYDHDNIAKNHSEPKVAFLVNTDADVETRAFTKDQYDEAVTYRNGFFASENTETGDIAPAKFSLSSDSQGRELNKAQREYFKDSKVVDENGNLKVMYHGTPNGDFTVFKDGTYFTENKWYADLYQNPNASSISTGKAATNPKTYEVYLDIKKPFDLSDAEAREIYINEYIKGGNAVGINPYLSDAEYDKIDTIDWTEGEDLREFLIDNGYDYDGLVLDEGAVGGYGEDVKYRGKSYVIFSPEQVKTVDNQKPTSNPDIRFSLSNPVEETKDLMALHNLKSNELLKSLELGGLPMPSIAITKAEAGHDQYGEISLILPKESIDPQASRDNKVYGGDAWTPTYPRMEYKANDTVAKKISDKYYAMSDEYGSDKVRPLYDYVYEAENALNRSGGESALKEGLYDDTRMMQVYLLDSGKGEVPTVQKEIRTELTDNEVSMYEFLAQRLGDEVVNGVNQTGLGSPVEHRKAYWENHGEAIKEAYGEFLSKEFGFTEEDIKSVFSNMKTADFLKIVRDAKRYQTNGRVTIKTEADYKATQEAIREAAGEGYKAWVDDLFGGIEEKSGIRNNRDYFTPSGDRRSWDALHWENTLENVVKAMKQQDRTGSEAVFGVHKFFATSSKDYGSIAEIKADADRLHKIDDGDYQAAKDAFEQRFSDIAVRIMDKTESNQFIAMDNAMECIVDAVRDSKTQAGIYKELSQYKHLNVTEQDVADIVSLVNDISNMPTGYFEAKPMRAVGFDEVGVFVIPRNADAKLKQELLNRGYSIAEYDPDVDGDRQKVVNSFEEYKFSLSREGETPKKYGNYNVYGKDLLLEQDDIAPVQDVAPVSDAVAKPSAKNIIDMPDEPSLYDLYDERDVLEKQAEDALAAEDVETLAKIEPRYNEVMAKIRQMEADMSRRQSESLESLNDADAPAEMDAPYSESGMTPDDPFYDRDMKEVSKDRKVKAYMYDNPEVKPFFQEEAEILLGELYATEKPETIYNGDLKYNMSYEFAKDIPDIIRTPRVATEDIVYLRDTVGMSYADIEKGLKAIIEDNGAENIAAAKKIEFILNDRLMNGYTAYGFDIPANQDYIDTLNAKQATENNEEAGKQLFESDDFVPDDIAPADDIAPVADKVHEAIRPKQTKEPSLKRVNDGDIAPSATYETTKKGQNGGQRTMFAEGKVAEVLDAEPETPKKKNHFWSKLMEKVLDKGFVFENLSKKTKNRELEAKWNFIRYAESRAQTFMKKGADGVKSLDGIRAEVEGSGLTKQFYQYMYHALNVDRMTLADRYDGMENKAVFGDSVTAEVSREAVAQMEAEHPEFKQWAQDVYGYMNSLRGQLVANGVISQETADLWAEMYPHYVPIRRLGDSGLNINVPLDTGKTGVNAPIKRATGGNRDIMPLFDTMAQRTLQTYRATSRNSFGVELKNALGTTVSNDSASVDDVIDSIDAQDGLLQEGKNGASPTFTVFENGERVTFEITEEMYEALRPTSDMLKYRNKVLGGASNIFRGLVTEYNPVFMVTNAIKDVQDVLINSQHAAKTYWNIPKAIKEMATKGKWYTEYLANGGEQNTYFDNETNTFAEDRKGIMKLVGMPLHAISAANNVIERIPRLAEYIASRESGRSIEVSMLDAARVTTNFAAGGDVTKALNRNGFTFLNASVQGAMQQVRNVREAKMNGLKGWVSLAAKVAVAGLPAMFLNGLLWDDDEDYEELSDYVKDNYYIVAKYGDGQFVRIPKGRALAVIQDAMEQVKNAATGDDEVDLKNFLELAVSNLAPTPDSHILAPIFDAMNNETWYGEDLVPSRLQDHPAAEQYDESTDSISRWLGEKLGDVGIDVSPYKINYLLNQYSGGLGDVVLPMLTPEAESGDNSFLGNVLAPFKDKFTTDSVMNNQNVSDFYDTKDELAARANASTATDEDVLSYKYMNSVNAELADLYERKREIQNRNIDDSVKYSLIRDIQEEINALTKDSMNSYGNVTINGEYATVGDRHYHLNDSGEWQKVNDKQLEKQEKVTRALGISGSEYWSNKEEYDFAYESPDKYAVAKSIGGYDAYKTYQSELYDIKADKDASGKSISGSRKDKVLDYINDLDADYGEKIILFKSEYKADDTYNYEIIDYLNSRDDISYEEMETILKELGFTVDKNGNIYWD